MNCCIAADRNLSKALGKHTHTHACAHALTANVGQRLYTLNNDMFPRQASETAVPATRNLTCTLTSGHNEPCLEEFMVLGLEVLDPMPSQDEGT